MHCMRYSSLVLVLLISFPFNLLPPRAICPQLQLGSAWWCLLWWAVLHAEPWWWQRDSAWLQRTPPYSSTQQVWVVLCRLLGCTYGPRRMAAVGGWVVPSHVPACLPSYCNPVLQLASCLSQLRTSTPISPFAELFPAVVREQGLGASNAFGRAGAALTPLFAFLQHQLRRSFVPLLVLGCLCFGAAVLSLGIPETLNEQYPDTIQDLNIQEQMKRKKSWRLALAGWSVPGTGAGAALRPSSSSASLPQRTASVASQLEARNA